MEGSERLPQWLLQQAAPNQRQVVYVESRAVNTGE